MVKINLKKGSFELFVFISVILSILFVIAGEYAVYTGWSVRTRNAFLWTGLFFDLVFSVEFLLRSMPAAKDGKFILYIKHETGWIDFLTSIPLLVLYSAPLLYITLNTEGARGTVFFTEMINVTLVAHLPLVMRCLRVMKLFRVIRIYNSEMTRHHAYTAGLTAVFTAGAVIILWAGIAGFSDRDDQKSRATDYFKMLVELESIATLNNLDFREACENFLISDHRIINIEYTGGKFYERLSNAEFRKYYNSGDYIKVPGRLSTLTVSIKDIKSKNAVNNIKYILIILLLAASFMFFYSRHFTFTVSDIAGALNAGFRKRDYNLMIKIRDEYKDEELYRLAGFYNEAYLPAKLRKRDMAKEGSGTPLTINTVKDFKNKIE